METRTVQLNVQTNAATTQDEFKRLHQEIAKAEQEFEDLNNTLGETDAATVAAKQKVTDLRGAYTQLNQTATDLDGTFEQVYGQLQPLTTRMGEAEDRLYELALAGKQATQEYKDLMAATQNYLRTQMQVDLQVEAGAMPMAQKLTMAVGGVAGAFGAAEGAIALFGVESQAMQQTLLRLNALLAITSGMMAIKEAIPVWQSMGVAAKNALAGIRAGVLATGIGALVIAVGALVVYWDDIKKAVNGVGSEQEKLNKKTEKNAAAAQRKYDLLVAQEGSLKLQGKTEKEILQIKINGLNSLIKESEIRLKNAELTAKLEIEAAKRNKEILQNLMKFGLESAALAIRVIAAPIDFLVGKMNEIYRKLGQEEIKININDSITKTINSISDSASKIFFDPKEVEEKANLALHEQRLALTQMKSDRDGFLVEIKEMDKKSVSTTSKIEKEKLDLTRQNRDKEVALMQEGIEKERTIIKEKYKREKEDLEANSKDKIVDKEQYAAAEKLIQENLDKELLDLQKKYAELKLQQNITEEEKQLNATIATREKELSYMADSFEKEGELKQTNFEKQRLLAELNFDKAQNDLNAQFDAGTLAREEYDRLTLLNSQKYHEANKALDEQAKKEQEARDKAEFERRQAETTAKVQIVKDSLSLISEITTLFGSQNEKAAKRAFLVDKAAKLASASISGIEGTINAYKTAQSSPITALFPAYPAIQAGLAGAFAAVNIAKISQSKFGGSTPTQDTGGGGGAAAGGGGMTAQFNTIGTSGINQLATLQQQPVQAYVVSGEVTSAQSLDRNRVQNATL